MFGTVLLVVFGVDKALGLEEAPFVRTGVLGELVVVVVVGADEADLLCCCRFEAEVEFEVLKLAGVDERGGVFVD